MPNKTKATVLSSRDYIGEWKKLATIYTDVGTEGSSPDLNLHSNPCVTPYGRCSNLSGSLSGGWIHKSPLIPRVQIDYRACNEGLALIGFRVYRAYKVYRV